MAPVLVVQIALLFALVPLLYTTPPDPLWMPGIYDDADQDDVVGILMDEGLALAKVIGAGGARFATKSRSVTPMAGPPLIASSRSTPRLRSPPR